MARASVGERASDPVRVQPLDDAGIARLKQRLDDLAGRFDRRYLETDPLQFVHRYADPVDREVVGLLTAGLAYGKVSIILRSMERVLAIMGSSPAAFVASFDPALDAGRFDGFKHRFNDGDDIALWSHLVGQQLRAHGSLGALFAAGYDDDDEHVAPALAHFVDAILAGDPRPLRTEIAPSAPFRYLLTSPDNGSACKRMLLFLRWMIRPADGLDLGCWSFASPSKLLIPLDTHVFRLGRYLGLLERRTHDLRAAIEMTRNLVRLDPDDPTRYDFALARLGILDLCPRRRDPQRCAGCDLLDVCRLV